MAIATRTTTFAIVALVAALLVASSSAANNCPLIALQADRPQCGSACYRLVFVAAMLTQRSAGVYTTSVAPLADASQRIDVHQSGTSGYIRAVFWMRGDQQFRVNINASQSSAPLDYYHFMYATNADPACAAGVDLLFRHRPGRYHTYFGFGRHQRPHQLKCANSSMDGPASTAYYFDQCTGVGRCRRVVRLPAGPSITDGNPQDMVMHYDTNLPQGMCAGGAGSCFTQPYITKPGSWIPTP